MDVGVRLGGPYSLCVYYTGIVEFFGSWAASGAGVDLEFFYISGASTQTFTTSTSWGRRHRESIGHDS